MAKETKNGFFHKNADVIALLLIAAVCSLLALSGSFGKLELRLYDMMLALPKESPQERDILLVEIDDDSIEAIGTWPWTRDTLGSALIRMKELGARTAVFDIEYLEPSARAAVQGADELVLSSFAEGEALIAEELSQKGALLDDGRETLVPGDFSAWLTENVLYGMVDPVLSDISRDVLDSLSRDNDSIFAQDVQFFGNAWLTLNLRNVHENPSGVEYAKERFLLSNVVDEDGLIERGNEASFLEETAAFSGASAGRSLVPALETIIDHASGAGFTNVFVDGDGTRRRVELLSQYEGAYAAQLAFAPLLRYLSVQKIVREKNALVLQDALFPGASERRSVRIPLDSEGRMLINWLHGEYAEGFRHESVMFLYLLDQMEDYVVSCIGSVPSGQGAVSASAAKVLEAHRAASDTLDGLLVRCYGFESDGSARYGTGLSESDYERCFREKEAFYSSVDDFFADALVSDAYGVAFAPVAETWDVFREYLSDMKSVYAGSVCLIGFTAAASTDFGVTPFSRSYANLGTHANVLNTILNESFITPVSRWWGMAAVLIVSLAVILLCRRLKSSGARNVLSLVFVVLPAAVPPLLMATARIYVPVLFPLLLAVATYIALFVMRFADVVRQSTFLRNTFGAYVAPEVVSQIIKNPEVAQLGGSDKCITALFSDVKSFSKFSETVNDPVRLVHILNEYLGALSDAIMDNHGTIDKYVGDEIVSFFGAPIENPSHAFDALCAALRMKEAEAEYNKKHFDFDHDIPFPLESRVGVNTGLMVVGNMGTEKKLNYTVMGNNVNLASRLEGVNKIYGTWIMCSQSTWEAADSGSHKGELLARALDYVRVVNINTPVRIFSVVGKRSELPPQALEAAGLFNEGTARYLKGDFVAAKKFFDDAARCYPQDASSLVFSDRCSLYAGRGVPDGWDGVYTMETK